MPTSIIDISHDFFDEVVKPILQTHFPDELAQAAIGIFGYGSEALRLDDALSSDHHWGLRIDALFPDAIFRGPVLFREPGAGHRRNRICSGWGDGEILGAG